MAKKVSYKNAEGVRNSIKIEFYQFLQNKKILFSVKDKQEEMDEFLKIYTKVKKIEEKKPLMELIEDTSGNTILQEVRATEEKMSENDTKKDKPAHQKISVNIIDNDKKWTFRGTSMKEHHREPDGNEMVVLNYRSVVEVQCPNQ